ncbi:kxDL motif-containing protein CG10681 isoform X1 [Anabrus simplex]|uniref:kxDL motif-containing protein CG10681 isoform X1 n=1 Tax=Anabrus simplex TaxID=316456 RepID=UPI0034DD2B1E
MHATPQLRAGSGMSSCTTHHACIPGFGIQFWSPAVKSGGRSPHTILLQYDCVKTILRLQRFEKTNEMLTNCNALSVNRLKSAGTEFKKHTQLLLEMKKDLENIFKRMRVLKTKLANQYPEAFAAAEEQKIRVSKSEEEFSAEKDKMDSKPPTSITQPDLVKMGLQKSGECSSVADLGDPDPCSGDSGGISRPLKRGNSSSTDSPNGNSNNDSSPCTSDTG